MPEFTLLEFTRSLRSLAVPSARGSDHDLIWQPLVQARTLAHKAVSMEAQVAAFDAARLEKQFRDAIATLAERRHAKSAPDRRALAAELDVLGDPLWSALADLNAAAERAKAASKESRRAEWERWVTCVQLMFRAADDWWTECLPALAESGGRRGALWRRVLRRSVR